jgi:hypothetical protein
LGGATLKPTMVNVAGAVNANKYCMLRSHFDVCVRRLVAGRFIFVVAIIVNYRGNVVGFKFNFAPFVYPHKSGIVHNFGAVANARQNFYEIKRHLYTCR